MIPLTILQSYNLNPFLLALLTVTLRLFFQLQFHLHLLPQKHILSLPRKARTQPLGAGDQEAQGEGGLEVEGGPGSNCELLVEIDETN